MRLRRPCKHDRYDDHFPPNEDLPGWETKYAQMGYERETKGWFWCPGGEFLPEDALVIELGSWPLWLTEIISEWGLDPQTFLSDVEDAYVESLEAESVGGLA